MNNRVSEDPGLVGIVVDPTFGSGLRALPDKMPVWIVESPVNRWAANRLRREREFKNHLEGITTFWADATSTPDQWCLNILDAVDLHHGVHSCDPPYFGVHVIGCTPTRDVEAKLLECGLRVTAIFEQGFRAVRLEGAAARS